jgi:predicted dinucleotide-binding enzyme
MKIDVVGSGRIGGLIGTLWSRGVHDVLFSSGHPESLDRLVEAAKTLPAAERQMRGSPLEM